MKKFAKEDYDITEDIKTSLVSKTEPETIKNLIKNAEFNDDVRRNYNAYKRMIREKLLKQQEDSKTALALAGNT